MAQGGTTGSMFAGFSQTAPEPAQPATSAAAPPPGNPRVLASASSASSSARRVRPVDVTDAYSTAAPAAAPSYPQPQPSDGYFAGVDPLAEGEGSQMHPHPVGVQDSKASTGGGLRAPGQANPERRQRQGNHPERQGEADPERQREGHHPERQQREGNPGPPIQRPQASEASIYSTALSGAPADGGLAGMDGAESAIRVSKRESKSGVSEGAGPAISSNSATAVSTGAAARSKIPPVAKGFSQMDWLRLTNSGADLSGLKGGPRRRIQLEEVKQHRREEDAWTILKGKVYNISPYIKFHPGGKDFLMKGAGRDCTALFNKYHAWVNFEFMLEKCCVGVLDPADSSPAGPPAAAAPSL